MNIPIVVAESIFADFTAEDYIISAAIGVILLYFLVMLILVAKRKVFVFDSKTDLFSSALLMLCGFAFLGWLIHIYSVANPNSEIAVSTQDGVVTVQTTQEQQTSQTVQPVDAEKQKEIEAAKRLLRISLLVGIPFFTIWKLIFFYVLLKSNNYNILKFIFTLPLKVFFATLMVFCFLSVVAAIKDKKKSTGEKAMSIAIAAGIYYLLLKLVKPKQEPELELRPDIIQE